MPQSRQSLFVLSFQVRPGRCFSCIVIPLNSDVYFYFHSMLFIHLVHFCIAKCFEISMCISLNGVKFNEVKRF